MLSHTEENYLKTIYHLSNSGSKSVTTNSIAEMLKTKPASVSDMIKKLNNKEMISYVKYQGVNITEAGRKVALAIIRKHRLWEVFLVNKLKFSWDEVHEIAEQLEHIKSPLLTQKLDEFLDFPKFDPHGDPIPDQNGNFRTKITQIPLNEMSLKQFGEVAGVKNTNTSFLKHLDKLNIKIGTKIEISEIIPFDNSMEIRVDQTKKVYISDEIAKNLLISK